jgi:hypothetical protein
LQEGDKLHGVAKGRKILLVHPAFFIVDACGSGYELSEIQGHHPLGTRSLQHDN